MRNGRRAARRADACGTHRQAGGGRVAPHEGVGCGRDARPVRTRDRAMDAHGRRHHGAGRLGQRGRAEGRVAPHRRRLHGRLLRRARRAWPVAARPASHGTAWGRDGAAGRAALGGVPCASGDCVSDAVRRRWRGLPCATGRGAGGLSARGRGPRESRPGERRGRRRRSMPTTATRIPSRGGPASRGSRFGRSVAAGPAPRARPPPAARRFAADASGASPAATSPTTSGAGHARPWGRTGRARP